MEAGFNPLAVGLNRRIDQPFDRAPDAPPPPWPLGSLADSPRHCPPRTIWPQRSGRQPGSPPSTNRPHHSPDLRLTSSSVRPCGLTGGSHYSTEQDATTVNPVLAPIRPIRYDVRLMTANPTIPWKRFWHPLGKPVNLGHWGGGFLHDPEEGRFGCILNPEVRTLEQFLDHRCLVLCGEPTMPVGNSTVSRRFYRDSGAGCDDVTWTRYAPNAATCGLHLTR
jgi:hypothetical protein